MASPTANQVADFFLEVYGADRLYITCLVASVDGGDQISTFGSDNIKHMSSWLRMVTAKLESGSVASVSMVVRVFDFDNKIEVLGARGRVAIPCKERAARLWLDPRTLDDEPGPATGLSGLYSGGTLTRWDDPVFRTRHTAISAPNTPTEPGLWALHGVWAST
jgi:hypothetical protein